MQNQTSEAVVSVSKKLKKKKLAPVIPDKTILKALRVPKLIKDKSKAFSFKQEEDLFGARLDREARLSSRDYKTVIPNRYVGIEIELNNAGLNKADKAEWKDLAGYCSAIKNDGSVDGDGVELNTVPARGLAFHKQIEVVGASLKALGAKANKSCGLHVHVDASDYTGADAFKLALLWAKIEGLVFETLPVSRRTNTYCGKYSNSIIEKIKASKHKLEHTTVDPVLRRFGLGSKYQGLNFGSYFRLKTFEFRCHEGTSDGTEMALWGMVCAEIVSFAKRNPISAIRELALPDLTPIFKEHPILLKYIKARIKKATSGAKKAFL